MMPEETGMRPSDAAVDREALVAPCGMDCALCSAYLAFAHGIPKQRGVGQHCTGCRIRGKQCSFLKKHCRPLAKGTVRYCYECPDFPCERLRRLDAGYRTRYWTSFIDNLEEIRRIGITGFVAAQAERHRCPQCGGTICVHDKRCYHCDPPGAKR